MDSRFQLHLLQVQANEMVKYIETLEKYNAKMLQFIRQNGLEEAFAKMVEPKEDEANLPRQTSSPIEDAE